MADQSPVNRQALVQDVLDVVRFLYEQERSGQRVRLPEASGRYGKKLLLDFSDYVKFLRRFHYLLIHRADQSLVMTEEGRGLMEAGIGEGFEQEMIQHFGDLVQEAAEEETVDMPDEPGFDLSDVAAEAAEPPRPAPAARAAGEPRFVENRPGRPAEPPRPPPRAATAVAEPAGVPMPATAAGVKADAKYTRYDALGSGGLGTVYRGRLGSLSMDVAIKEIKELFTFFNFLQRSEVVKHLREAVGQMALLSHPGVVKILDQNTEVAHPFFVMEFAPGGSLRSAMAGQPLEIDRALCLFAQMVYALRYAHASQVVHGNLKPENVLLDAQGNVRLSDFGMTRLLASDADRAVPLQRVDVAGYLAPEQMSNTATSGVASDVYALGILLYEMLTGALPGRRSPLPSEVRAEVPKGIDELFDRTTKDDPDKRYPDLDALLDDFYKAFPDKRYLEKGRLVLYAGPGR